MSTAVILPARNEEMFLSRTLSHLLRQTIEPKKIIVINDGSQDKTRNIALNFEAVEVIDITRDSHEYAVHAPILAQIINQGLKKIFNDDFEYVIILGSDHLIPPHYLSTIIEKMKKDNKVVICSGQIRGERSVVLRGSGRVVKYDFWKKIGLLYPENYGFETYLLVKAAMMGYKVRILRTRRRWMIFIKFMVV
jgi:glycosyltransferase involved in cell wall biosynthesis